MKYNNQPPIATFLGKKYGQILAASNLKNLFDMVVCVPLHPKRLQERGYNQSDLLAASLATTLGINYAKHAITRIKPTATQTKKDRIARLKNMENAFSVNSPELLANKHLLLVDDILTTGATLEACVQALLDVGLKKISIATLAIAE